MKKFQNPWKNIAVHMLPNTRCSQASTTAAPITEGMKTAKEEAIDPVPWEVPKRIGGKATNSRRPRIRGPVP